MMEYFAVQIPYIVARITLISVPSKPLMSDKSYSVSQLIKI